MHDLILRLAQSSCLRSAALFLRVALALGAVTLVTLLAVTAASGSAAPPPPHPLTGYGDCLQCHGPGKSATAVPASHASYGPETCATCHQPAAAQGAPGPTAAPASASPSSTTSAPSPAPSPDPTGTPPQAPAALGDNRDAQCLSCHQNPNLSVKLSSGEGLSLYVDGSKFHDSVHGRRLGCTDCHPNMAGATPHPIVRYDNTRQYATTYYEACKRCHFANYTKTLDSVHYSAMGAGNQAAPVCTDCHGAHYITKPAEPRSSISEACGKCHADVSRDYADSVHGKALMGEQNPDVPVCTTCHGVHSIQGATSDSFRLASAQLCASCHGDQNLMAKYGLSTDVVKTYLDDFHGRTVSFYQQQSPNAKPIEPLCIDCHGIHDIKSTKDPDSPVIKANLQATCQKCHPDASPNFPSAWLSHYEPSADKAPLVYYIRMYYWVLIPVMIGGLVLHIGIDLWRLARNR